MRLSNVAALYGVRLRAQFGQELLALIGIAVGVSLLFAALVANTSLTGSFERLTKAVVGDADYQITARGDGLDEGLLRKVQALPNVRAAAAFLEVRAEANTPHGHRSVLLIGATPEFAELGGALTGRFSYAFLVGIRALAVPTPLAESLHLALGQSIDLDVRGHSVKAPMGAKLQRSDIGGLLDSPFAVGQLRYVQELSAQLGEISRISVAVKPGRELAAKRELGELVAGRANVRPASFDAELFRQAASPTRQSTMMFSLFSALVGFLFAFSAVLLTVPQRRRLILDLRIEGYGPGTAAKVLLFDALVLGTAASALGVVLGIQISEHVFDGAPGFLTYAFAFGSQQIVTPASVIVAGASGIVASCIAVLGPTVSTTGGTLDVVSPDGRHDAGVRLPVAWLAVFGLGCWVAALGVVELGPASASLGIGGLILLTVAMLLVLPGTLALLVERLEGLTGSVRSIVLFLAISDLRDQATRARSIAVAATGAVAVFAAVALQGAHGDLQRGLDRTSHDLSVNAPLSIMPPGNDNLLATTAFPMPSLNLPDEVTDMAAYRGGFLDIGKRRAWVLGPPPGSYLPIPRGQLVEGETATATRRLRAGGWAVLSAGLAQDRGLKMGDAFVLPAPVPTAMRVAALSTNLGWPPGAIVINADDYAHAWGSDDVSALNVRPAPGISVAKARNALRAALGADSGLVVKTSFERERDQRRASRDGLARLTQIASLVLISAMIAMAAVMAGMIWQRRTFLTAMSVEGYGPSQLWGSLLVEAVVLIGVGCTLGAVFGLFGQELLSRALTDVTGFPVAPRIAWRDALLTSLALAATTVAIVASFGIHAAHVSTRRHVD